MGAQPVTGIVKQTVVELADVKLHLVAPPPDLAPYISLYYRTDVAPGAVVEECVPPEGANLRTGNGALLEAAIGANDLQPAPDVILSGPTSQAVRMRIGEGHYWGIGLLPLGFAKFLGIPMSAYANRFADLGREPAASPLLAMVEQLVGVSGALDRPVETMNERFRTLLSRRVPQADTILATHKAIVSDIYRSVASLARELSMSTRTLERFCSRNFGFSPQLLLRRQRFLRSLASFLIDPTMKWVHTLDCHYHDHAHFVRDFRFFMGMSPSEYAAMNHPITTAVVRARLAARGEAMQLLHWPSPPLTGPALGDFESEPHTFR